MNLGRRVLAPRGWVKVVYMGRRVRGSRERVALPVPGVLLQSLAVLLIDGLHAVAALDPGGIGCGSLSSSV